MTIEPMLVAQWRTALDRLVKATLGNDPVELEEALEAAQKLLQEGYEA